MEYSLTNISQPSLKVRDATVRGYEGSGTFKKEGVCRTDRFFAYSGSGTATFSGENFFSQAPQSTIFGVGDTITASGSADESFVPATVVNTVLFDISGTGAESRNIPYQLQEKLLLDFWFCIWYQTCSWCRCKNCTI